VNFPACSAPRARTGRAASFGALGRSASIFLGLVVPLLALLLSAGQENADLRHGFILASILFIAAYFMYHRIRTDPSYSPSPRPSDRSNDRLS
jgi:hypothetical protein